MQIGLAGDHGGFELKQRIAEWVRRRGHHLTDFGPLRLDPDDDYPDFVLPLAHAVARGEIERGIAVCGSGVGAAIAACKVADVRACVCHDPYSGHQGVEHDDMNVLCLGGRIVGPALAEEIVGAFLDARFSGEPRHVRRLEKIRALSAHGGAASASSISSRSAAMHAGASAMGKS